MTLSETTTSAFFDELEKIGAMKEAALPFSQAGRMARALRSDAAKPISHMPAGPMFRSSPVMENPAKERMRRRIAPMKTVPVVGGHGMAFV